MPRKIYENEHVTLYANQDFEMGDEPIIADAIFECALKGYLGFASHMKYKMDKVHFLIQVSKAMQQRVYEEIKELPGAPMRPQELFSIECRQDLAKMIILSTPREQKIMDYRFGLTDGVAHTLEETGQEYGVTRVRIRQIEQKAWEKVPALELEKFIEKYPEESMKIMQLKATWQNIVNKNKYNWS